MVVTATTGEQVVAHPSRDPQTRAIVREIVRGNHTECLTCGEQVRFRARLRHLTVICNVYTDGRWNRVEHYHLDCYRESGEPHGHADSTEIRRPPRASTGVVRPH